MRRARARLPVACARRAVKKPAIRLPKPPPNSGIPASSASAYLLVVVPYVFLRKVGSHVT